MADTKTPIKPHAHMLQYSCSEEKKEENSSRCSLEKWLCKKAFFFFPSATAVRLHTRKYVCEWEMTWGCAQLCYLAFIFKKGRESLKIYLTEICFKYYFKEIFFSVILTRAILHAHHKDFFCFYICMNNIDIERMRYRRGKEGEDLRKLVFVYSQKRTSFACRHREQRRE